TALYGLTRSLEKAHGRYYPLRELRNSIEHHVVLTLSRPAHLQHAIGVHIDSLRESAFNLGRLAKAALWYFAAACFWSERQRARLAAASGFPIVRDLGGHTQRH